MLKKCECKKALFLVANIVTSSKALVTTSNALVPSSFIVTTSKALVPSSVALVSTSEPCDVEDLSFGVGCCCCFCTNL